MARDRFDSVKPSKVSVPLIGEAIGNVEYKVVNRIPFDAATDLFVGEVVPYMCVRASWRVSFFGKTQLRLSTWEPSMMRMDTRWENIMRVSQE